MTDEPKQPDGAPAADQPPVPEPAEPSEPVAAAPVETTATAAASPGPTLDQPWARIARSVNPAMVVALIALLLGVWQWNTAQRDAAKLQTDLARRVAEMDTTTKETRLIADQVRNTVRDLESRLGLMEARLIETQNQRIALESLYQELARNRDEWVLAEIEQILITANQQLQLAGNVRSAIIALEAADKRLAQADRPGLLALRRVINRDIEKLKATPDADVPGLALKLDNLIAGIDGFPLAGDHRPSGVAGSRARDGDTSARLSREIWQDMKDLLRIRVAESRDVPLLAPEQAYFVRENLKLKLLSARIALLGRDEPSFRADMKVAADWLGQYFDTAQKPVTNAQRVMKQFANAELAIQLPDIGDSLQAVRTHGTGRGAGMR
jgi:uroporphyrin-3 C-methyltransferase